MAQSETIRVRGLRELSRDLGKVSRELRRSLNRKLVEAGQIVAIDARARLARYDGRSAMGIRPRMRGGSVIVEQRRGRVTGLRPDYGALQMRRALLPALAAKSPEVEAQIEQMLDGLIDNNGF